jgi:hypothetical protein
MTPTVLKHGRARYERAAARLAAAEAELAARLGDTGNLTRCLARLADVLATPLTAEYPAVR